ncbi:MAG: hypothetical protein JW944_08970 [Deltaproteobacteria bacterium]|nr:hypothetical protein [Deltaproteobacteria bacterium]
MKAKIHLFPHSYLPESAIRKLLSLFGPLRVYLPWFMNPPGFFKNYELEVINPPEDYRPEEGFKAIVSGYRAWAEQNHDRSLMETLKISGSASQDDGAAWEIRRLLKGEAKSVPGTKDRELPLKHHLILHLASEIEMRHFEITGMIEEMKGKGPVLAGLSDYPDEGQDVFADMDDIVESGIQDCMNDRQMMDAWFGLFGGYIKEDDILATCRRSVMDYISSQWDEAVAEGETSVSYFVSLSLPFRNPETYKEGDMAKIRKLALGFNEDPERYISKIKGFGKALENTFSCESSQPVLKIQIRHFPKISVDVSFERNGLLRRISGKTIILVSFGG